MSAARLAWGLWALAVALVIPGPVLTTAVDATTGDVPFLIAFVAVQLGAATAGAVVASRLPGNAIGWIFLTLGAGLALAFAANGYAEVGLASDSGPLPLDEVAAWMSSWLFLPVVFGSTLLLLLLFPAGRPISPAWRRLTRALVAVVGVATVALAFKPGMVGPEGEQVANPMGAPGTLGELLEVVDLVTNVLAVPAFACGVAAIVVRFRRSHGVERQQLKWFALAAAFVGAGLAASIMIPGGTAADVAFLLGMLALAALPVAAGMAILRYRLYDIDVVINRTLVYGALTATLAAAYLGSVLVLQLALSPLTEDSDLAIAGSTLAVAALVRPLRGRIQALVDRRFYRRRYDAARTVEAFSARLRDQVDLEALAGDLRGVVAETVQPAHVSLWLRGAPR